MDPITAILLAGVVTWGTVGGGIRDTAAIVKGQTPPSHAYRTAKLAADERKRRDAHEVITRALDKGEPIPPALEPRRIRLRDIVRHWWEDALEDADAWRARRHADRPERKARAKAWRQKKKSQVKEGYHLLERRARERFAEPAPDSATGADDQDQGAGEPVPDNVLPFRRAEPEADTDTADDQDQDQGAGEPVPEADNTGNADSTGTATEDAMLNLSDAPTLAAHLHALTVYSDYLRRVASDMETMAAGMRHHQMGERALAEIDAAVSANLDAADRIDQNGQELEQAHRAVADARASESDSADGEYLRSR